MGRILRGCFFIIGFRTFLEETQHLQTSGENGKIHTAIPDPIIPHQQIWEESSHNPPDDRVRLSIGGHEVPGAVTNDTERVRLGRKDTSRGCEKRLDGLRRCRQMVGVQTYAGSDTHR